MHFRKSHILEALLLRKIYNLLNALYFDALSGLTNNFSWHFRRYQEKISSNRYCVHHSTLRQSFFDATSVRPTV